MRPKPKYKSEQLQAIDRIVGKEKGRAKSLKPGKKFLEYVRKITK